MDKENYNMLKALTALLIMLVLFCILVAYTRGQPDKSVSTELNESFVDALKILRNRILNLDERVKKLEETRSEKEV